LRPGVAWEEVSAATVGNGRLRARSALFAAVTLTSTSPSRYSWVTNNWAANSTPLPTGTGTGNVILAYGSLPEKALVILIHS
jgi:hypothetical protein